ncbi:MAG: T9SS type A sorting domain-containing protein [Bacteroidia bacterium]|nr:T9SS type A sorting domain-containing protein [Bacteroidia bacterium]
MNLKANYILKAVILFTIYSQIIFGQAEKKTTRDTLAPKPVPWTVAIEDINRVFIENKGQINSLAQQDSSFKSIINPDKIQFEVNYNGVNIYFTSTGVAYLHKQIPSISHEDREKFEFQEARGEADKKSNNYPHSKWQHLNMEWVGANKDVVIVAQQKVNNYFTYINKSDKAHIASFTASAFEKISYLNLYPGIDVEYTFPENKRGIKYTFIVHPGADLNAIRFNYEGVHSLDIDAKGNLNIVSEFGTFIDHAPNSFYINKQPVKSSFNINKNLVSFNVETYDKTKTLIIDPWTTSTAFLFINKAYDIDWDYSGNIYIHGGSTANPGYYQLTKMNNIGAKLWTFATLTTQYCMYGDFAVDRQSGSSFICEGTESPIPLISGGPSTLVKVNSLGKLVNIYFGTDSIDEMWRISYNTCTHKGVIGGGNIRATYQAATFDSTCASVNPVNILSTTEYFHDISLLAVDDTNCYMTTLRSNINPVTFDNVLAKCPVSTLTPTSFIVPNGYHFSEKNSNIYYSDMFGMYSNGFNGIAKGKNYLYTYDGGKIKQWNPWSGALINSLIISTDTFKCGGITVDGCDNVFVGTTNGVKEYNSSLVFVTSVPTADTVYDVALGIGGEIFACGNGFVSALPLFSTCTPIGSFTLSTNSTNATCAGNDGSATVAVTGATPSFSYKWIPGGQTTQTATGLAAGVYTIMAFENNGLSCSNSVVKTDTILVSASSGFTKQSHIVTPNTCYGNNNGTVKEIVSGGTPPYTYLWSAGARTSQIITGLAPGSYTVTVKDANGCKTIDSMRVTNVGTNTSILAASASITNKTCYNLFGSITLSVSGGSPTYFFTWSDGSSNANLYNLTTYATYSVVVSDAFGCSVTLTGLTVNAPDTNTVPILTSFNVSSACNGNDGKIFLRFSETLADNLIFSWVDQNQNNISGDSVLINLAPGTYTCHAYDNDCHDTIIILTVPLTVNALITKTDATCLSSNGIATINATGGVLPHTYSWSNGSTNATISNLSYGTYYLTVTDKNGCTASTTVQIYTSETPQIVSVTGKSLKCKGDNSGSVIVTGWGGTGTLSYNWSNGSSGSTVSGLAAGNYTVTVIDAAGCTVASTVNITEPPPITFTTTTTSETNGQSNGTAAIASSGGGTGLLQFNWSNSINGHIIVDLSCGIYSVTATDNNGCTLSSTATVACITGFNQVDSDVDFTMYPNPATATVTIETTTNKPYNIQLLNLLGEAIYYTRQPIINNVLIDVGSIAKGIYIVEIRVNAYNSVIRQRLVIQ